VGEVGGVGGDIDDGDHVHRLAEQTLIAQRLENQATDAAESVDSDFEGHGNSSCDFGFWIADFGSKTSSAQVKDRHPLVKKPHFQSKIRNPKSKMRRRGV